jgi:hypothetical protein
VRQVSRVVFAFVLASLGVVAVAATAGAGVAAGPVAPLTVVKTVSGPVPSGTTFTATVTCDGDILVTPGGPSDHVSISFDATGQPTTVDTYGFNDPGTCTVTETVTGGAATTTYACEGSVPEPPSTTTTSTTLAVPKSTGFSAQVAPDDPICPVAGPQAAPISVNIVNEGQTATVTIHNTFDEPAPQPAAQVVAQPTFTG